MSSFHLAPGEYFVECPYNKAHQVTNRIRLTHLDKCRREYKRALALKGEKVEIVSCRFNFAHQFSKVDIESHERRCQDQSSVIPTLAYHQHELPEQLAREAKRKQLEPEKHQKSFFGSKSSRQKPEDKVENWDKDARNDCEPGYSPQAKLKSKCYLYTPMGLSKSERKQHRREMNQRYQKDSLNEHFQQTGQAQAQSQVQGQSGSRGQNHGNQSRSSSKNKTLIASTNGRYIPGLNYADVNVKTEKDPEWDKETVGFQSPRRVEEDFLASNVKTELPGNWSAQQVAWETETMPRSPARMVDVKEENMSEPMSYDWVED